MVRLKRQRLVMTLTSMFHTCGFDFRTFDFARKSDKCKIQPLICVYIFTCENGTLYKYNIMTREITDIVGLSM